jgi:hypothetical protein
MKTIKPFLALFAGIILGMVMWLLHAPLWAIIGFAWLGADNSIIYQYVRK